MKAINIRFSEVEHQELHKYSKKLERSINDLVREAVRDFAEKLKQKEAS